MNNLFPQSAGPRVGKLHSISPLRIERNEHGFIQRVFIEGRWHEDGPPFPLLDITVGPGLSIEQREAVITAIDEAVRPLIANPPEEGVVCPLP